MTLTVRGKSFSKLPDLIYRVVTKVASAIPNEAGPGTALWWKGQATHAPHPHYTALGP